MAELPTIVLNSGRSMPALGMGTATHPQPLDEMITAAVIAAIELGYRHFDTASVYGSERAVSRGIAAALERGLVGSHDELFVTTKLWCTDMYAHAVVPALRESLRNLGLEYVDLYLVHQPARLRGQKTLLFTHEDVLPLEDMASLREAMEECQKLGLAQIHRGKQLHSQKAGSPPSAYQYSTGRQSEVEVHPLWQQKKLRDFCRDKGIHVSAYSPLGAIGVLWGTDAVLNCDEVKAIAHSTGKTRAQVCLRWGLEQGLSVIVKSFSKERLKENIGIFDWSLSEEENEKLSQLPQKRYILAEPFVSPDGLYKSHADFWDGEV